MNEPKQQQNTVFPGWTQLTLLDDVPPMGRRLIVIQSALRCPLCGAVLVHTIGQECEQCPRCGAVVDL